MRIRHGRQASCVATEAEKAEKGTEKTAPKKKAEAKAKKANKKSEKTTAKANEVSPSEAKDEKKTSDKAKQTENDSARIEKTQEDISVADKSDKPKSKKKSESKKTEDFGEKIGGASKAAKRIERAYERMLTVIEIERALKEYRDAVSKMSPKGDDTEQSNYSPSENENITESIKTTARILKNRLMNGLQVKCHTMVCLTLKQHQKRSKKWS